MTKSGRADLLPCNCFDKYYLQFYELTNDSLSVDESKLLWHWLTFRYDSPVLIQAYNNARAAWFTGDGKAYYKRPYVELSRNIDYLFSDAKLEMLNLMYAIDELSKNSPSNIGEVERLHEQLARMMSNINWQSVGGINNILDSLPR